MGPREQNVRPQRLCQNLTVTRGADNPTCAVRVVVWVVCLTALAPAAAGALDDEARIENHRCLNCHGQRRMAELTADERQLMVATDGPTDTATDDDALRPGLYVAPGFAERTVHDQLDCVACHTSVSTLPHPQQLGPVGCAEPCHANAGALYRRGVHAEALAHQDDRAPTCATCHGGHDILPKSNRQSRTYPLNIITLCSDCHDQFRGPVGGHEYVRGYLESVHGQAITDGGLVVAATCAGCHRAHDVLAADHPESPVHRDRIPSTCGQCHVGVVETYLKSVHGRKLAAGDERAPICTDCHTAHAITHANVSDFSLDIVSECGQCHDKPDMLYGRRSSLYETYRRSYHGQVTDLGDTRAARCSDCHGAHEILPVSDPASRLHADNRLEVCRSCHEGATAKFVQFDPHADYRDGQRYPVLHAVWLYFIIIMSATFGFFGLHSLLWFIRSGIERFRRGPHPPHRANPHAIERFATIDRVNHALMVISFFGLTLTGMPLFFSDSGWARVLADLLGGVAAAGYLHRIFAVMLLGNFVLHIYSLIQRRRHNGGGARQWLFGPNSMLPRRKDVDDCIGMFRWFFRGGAKPPFDRWTYWEKFDYWAEIVGTVIIGGSGLLLCFPTFFGEYLPGWIFNIAAIIHGYEALLAVGFIFTIHFFNAHLRLEKFPVDDVIFTGQLPESEFQEERPDEYVRAVEAGTLEQMRVAPAPQWQHWLALAVGVLAMAIGTAMVALIILAGLGIV